MTNIIVFLDTNIGLLYSFYFKHFLHVSNALFLDKKYLYSLCMVNYSVTPGAFLERSAFFHFDAVFLDGCKLL